MADMLANTVEADLIQQAREGDREALTRLLQENYRVVLGYFIKVTIDRSWAEDLTQETMLRAIQKLGVYNGSTHFSTWLIAIGTNLFRDELRRRRKIVPGTEDINSEPSVTGIDPDLELDLRAALGGLSINLRIPLVLKFFYDYSYDTIARLLKLPVGTVRSRLHNGIRELQRIMGEQSDTGEGMRGNHNGTM